MSLVFDALRQAEQTREKNCPTPVMESWEDSWSDARRDQRRRLHATIHVYGHALACKPFYKTAQVVNVSEHGARLLLNMPIVDGQKLMLINPAIEEPQVCTVVHVYKRSAASVEIGVEFPDASPEFWQALPAAKRNAR